MLPKWGRSCSAHEGPLQFSVTEGGGGPARWHTGRDRDGRHGGVEGWIEGITPSIEQLQLDGAFPASKALQPDRGLTIHQETVAVEGDPQPPAVVTVAQVLQGGIEQQPVDQHRLCLDQVKRNGRDQLGAGGLWHAQGVGSGPVQLDLGAGAGLFHRFAPGEGGIDADAVAARRERFHRHLEGVGGGGGLTAQVGSRRADPDRRFLVALHHQMGTESARGGPRQRPLSHTHLQRPGTGGKNGIRCRRNDLHLRAPGAEHILELLGRSGRSDFAHGATGKGSRCCCRRG